MTCERCGGDSGPYRMHADPHECCARLEGARDPLQALLGSENQRANRLEDDCKRLQAENERLTRELANCKDAYDRACRILDAEREAHARTRAELAIEAKSALLCNDALVAERRDMARLSGLSDWLESEHARACEKAEACLVAGDDRSWQDWYGRAVPLGEVLTKIKELEVTK